MREYIHPYAKALESELNRLKKAENLGNNKELLFSFYESNLARGISTPRILRLLTALRKTAEQLQKDFRETTKQDYEKFLIWMQRSDYAEGTIWTYKKILKVFHKWLNNGVCPESVSWFAFKKMNNQILPEQLLDQEDVKALLKAAINKRDKALIACLWETGARVGELGGMRIKDVSFDEFGGKILLSGKTGMRKIRIVNSAAYLLEWINSNPFSKNPDAPVWCCIEKAECERMSHAGIMSALRKIRKRSGITKPINPHHFRHSRATFMAQHLTEAQMKEYFGWEQDSRMAGRYVHLSGKQVDDAILKMCGLKKQEEQKDLLQREPCPRCKSLNEVTSNYCEKCWLPLSSTANFEMEQIEQKSQESLIGLMKLFEAVGNNPEKIRQAIIMLQAQSKGGI